MEQKLLGFDGFAMKMEEDGAPAAPAAAVPAGLTTLGDVRGMGAPVLAGRGITGSGDVPSAAKTKKKKKKKVQRVKTFDNFDK